MKTVHYCAGCNRQFELTWKPLEVGREFTPPPSLELVACTRQVDGSGAEVDCLPPSGAGRIVGVYGEAAAGVGAVSVRWFGPRGTVGSILATYRFDAKLA